MTSDDRMRNHESESDLELRCCHCVSGSTAEPQIAQHANVEGGQKLTTAGSNVQGWMRLGLGNCYYVGYLSER